LSVPTSSTLLHVFNTDSEVCFVGRLICSIITFNCHWTY